MQVRDTYVEGRVEEDFAAAPHAQGYHVVHAGAVQPFRGLPDALGGVALLAAALVAATIVVVQVPLFYPYSVESEATWSLWLYQSLNNFLGLVLLVPLIVWFGNRRERYCTAARAAA